MMRPKMKRGTDGVKNGTTPIYGSYALVDAWLKANSTAGSELNGRVKGVAYVFKRISPFRGRIVCIMA